MLVNFVLMLTVLLGFCALALDIGMFELKRLQLQNAADAAALSGMLELERNNLSGWQTAAAADATQNGFTQGVAGATVAITNAPAGAYSNDYSAVQATLSQPAIRAFSGHSEHRSYHDCCQRRCLCDALRLLYGNECGC